MQAIIRVRCYEEPIKGSRLAGRDYAALDVTLHPRPSDTEGRCYWMRYFSSEIALQLGRVRRMRPGDVLVAQVTLRPWTEKYYDNYYGAWEYDAGVDVLKSRTLVYRKGA